MNIKEKIKKIIPPSLLKFYHFCWVFLGAVIFGFSGLNPKVKIIGITGTSGKSTTTDFITRILEEAGNEVASISTVRFKLYNQEWENKYKMSMPGRLVIQKFLWQARRVGCNFIVLEVTSEGIRQFRHKFINFDTVVFTNLSPEHIESHGGFENYKNEKLKLFKENKNTHIINIDDFHYTDFLKTESKKTITYGMGKGDINLNNSKFKLQIEGGFNYYNGLAAAAVAKNYGINMDVCKKVLENAKGISGRMEIVAESPVKIVVDYAHTPEQLEAVYKTFNPSASLRTSKLVCVLGSCGGGRDKWKRPVLGELAKKYCKEIIITNEDPYDEDPMEIINQVAEKAGSDAKKILDRKEAIEKSISLAKPGDVVIITGKGSEPWMCLENGRKIPWDDRKIVKDYLNKK